MRGMIPLDGFHVPRGSRARCDRTASKIHVDRDFDAVIDGCAAPRQVAPAPGSTRASALYRRSFAAAIATPSRPGGDELVGGLYGVSLGGAFFGESMFHRARDASKVALVHLVARLRAGGFACSTRNL